MAADNQKEMVFSYDDSITVSNGQQLPMTSARQPFIIKFLHLLSLNFAVSHKNVTCAICYCSQFFTLVPNFVAPLIFVYTVV